MERRLSRTEEVMFHLDTIYPVNFTTLGRVRGPLTEAMVRRALDAAVARHPYLTARLEPDASGAPWLREGGLAPTLRWVQGGDRIAEAEGEMNLPFSRGQGPLVRCVVLEDAPDDHTLLLTFHHCIGDGFSGAFLLRDLVQAASASDGAPHGLVPLSDTLAMDHRFPRRARGWRSLWAQLGFALREILLNVRLGHAHVVRDRPEVLAPHRRARWIPVELDPATVARLSEKARSECTTVHGALSAAMILAAVHDAKAGPLRVGFGSPVNLRAHLEPAVGQDLGLFVSMAAWGGVVRPEMPFWDLARLIRSSTVSDQERGYPFAALKALALLFDVLGGGGLAPMKMAQRMETRAPTTGGLTNLGRLDIETRFGSLEIASCQFISSPSALGAWVSQATTLKGTLYWNFVWGDPAIAESHARALAGESVRLLRDAIGPPMLANSVSVDASRPVVTLGG